MTGADAASVPLVFVTVGTDHHRFDRLMGWMAEWLAAGRPVRCVVQHGPAEPPAGAEGHAFLPPAGMRSLFRAANVVVCQGGPSAIVESRQAGGLPIAVPRLAGLGEAVDDHQVRFCRHVAARGMVALAETAECLHAHLDRALANPTVYTVADDADDTDTAITRFGTLVDELVSAPRDRRRHPYPRDGRR